MIAVSKNIEKLWPLVMQDAIAAAIEADFFFFLRKGIIINESLMSAFSNEAPFGLLIALKLQLCTLQRTVKE